MKASYQLIFGTMASVAWALTSGRLVVIGPWIVGNVPHVRLVADVERVKSAYPPVAAVAVGRRTIAAPQATPIAPLWLLPHPVRTHLGLAAGIRHARACQCLGKLGPSKRSEQLLVTL